MPSTVTCSSLRQLLSALLASSHASAARGATRQLCGGRHEQLFDAAADWLERLLARVRRIAHWPGEESRRAEATAERPAVRAPEADHGRIDEEAEIRVMMATWM